MINIVQKLGFVAFVALTVYAEQQCQVVYVDSQAIQPELHEPQTPPPAQESIKSPSPLPVAPDQLDSPVAPGIQNSPVSSPQSEAPASSDFGSDSEMKGEYTPFDFESCQYQTAICVFYEKNPQLGGNKKSTVAANTRLNGKQPKKPLHAHGITWTKDVNDKNNQYKKDVLDYISITDHYKKRGYYGHVPMFPKCSCIENMPEVVRSDCSQIADDYNPDKKGSKKFVPCRGVQGKNNDLAARYKKINPESQPMLEKYLKR